MPTPFLERRPPRLVFAGMSASNIGALLDARPEAVMVSFETLKSKKSRQLWQDTRAVMAERDWQPTIYIDSGVYTLLRRAGLARDKSPSSTERTRLVYSQEKVDSFFANYLDFLGQFQEDFDFIVETDVDPLYFGEEITGLELALRYRKQLRRLVGDRLIPVWHPEQGEDGWLGLLRDFPYVCLGQGTDFNSEETRWRLQLAREAGVKVHALGVGSLEVLARLPLDTADTASWLRGARFGWFLRWAYSLKGKGMTHGDTSRAHRFEQSILKPLGFTRDDLLTDNDNHYRNRLVVGIKLYELRMEELRQLKVGNTPRHILRPSLFEGAL